MSNKKFILNADDFGYSKPANKAVLNGYNHGFLRSASLMANGAEFLSAVNEILPECPNLGIGVHLNIIEGNALTTGKPFDKGFLKLLMNSAEVNETYLAFVEREFRAQIEAVRKYTSIDHIDSHVHVHAIPGYFRIAAKLAKEYEIPFIRTQYEEPYFVPFLQKNLNFKYPVNLIKVALLNYFTTVNKPVVEEFGLRTNDHIIGVGYTGMMDAITVEYGLNAIESDGIVEALIHPRDYDLNDTHRAEFGLSQSKDLEYAIKRLGYEITNYKQLAQNN